MKNTNKHIIFVLIGMLALGVLIMIMQSFKKSDNLVNYATTFEECIENGNAIMESYPQQCQAGNGTVFIEVIESDAIDQNIADEFNRVLEKNQETLEILQFSIAAEKRPCGSLSRQSCLVVNEENFYDSIDGFEFERGNVYKITVEKYLRFGTDDPASIPQDVGMFGYRLVTIDSKQPVDTKIPKDVSLGVKKCVIAGCSSQLCVRAENAGHPSTCEFLPQYACYRTASCELQTTGECGWTQTEELKQCITNSQGF